MNYHLAAGMLSTVEYGDPAQAEYFTGHMPYREMFRDTE